MIISYIATFQLSIMVLFDVYGSCESIGGYIGWEIIGNLDFQDFFFQEKMKISRYYFDHNFSCRASTGINKPILES